MCDFTTGNFLKFRIFEPSWRGVSRRGASSSYFALSLCACACAYAYVCPVVGRETLPTVFWLLPSSLVVNVHAHASARSLEPTARSALSSRAVSFAAESERSFLTLELSRIFAIFSRFSLGLRAPIRVAPPPPSLERSSSIFAFARAKYFRIFFVEAPGRLGGWFKYFQKM